MGGESCSVPCYAVLYSFLKEVFLSLVSSEKAESFYQPGVEQRI